ncbi:MAG TPA: choice-of-anchor D domain-containing protein [Candidatus Acidoferrales bacterium]|nr:choice-of-anchor D domain-containing protein [Candidatus Acidoferrales bacterium]
MLAAFAIFATLIWLVTRTSRPVRAQQAAAQKSSASAALTVASGAQYANVRGLAVDAANELYVSLSAMPPAAQCVSPGTTTSASKSKLAANLTVIVFSNCASAPNEDPSGIAVTPQGQVYLANRLQNTIRLLDTVGGKVTVVPRAMQNGAAASASHLNLFEPAGLSLGAFENLYVADRGNNRIVTLNSGADNFSYLAHVLDADVVAADSARGELYVASPGSNQIFKIDLATNGVAPFAGTGGVPESDAAQIASPIAATSATLAAPDGVAVDGAGNVFVADTGANMLLRVDAKTAMLTRVATATNFSSPAALAIDRQGDVFVADRGNQRVLEFPKLSAPASPANIFLTPSSWDYGDEPTGGMAPVEAFTLTNNSTVAIALNSNSFTFAGANPNDFTETTSCIPQVAANGGTCQVNVTFMPLGTGARSATLEVADSDPSSPQTAALSGTGDDYQINGTIIDTTQSVIAGTTATYSLSVTADNVFSGTVTLQCPTILPNGSNLTCQTSPPSLSLTPGATQPFKVMLGTGAATTKVPPAWPRKIPPARLPMMLIAAILALLALVLRIVARRSAVETLRAGARPRRTRLAFGFALVAAMAASGCGGNTITNPVATNPGTYSIMILATAQNATRSITLILNVN